MPLRWLSTAVQESGRSRSVQVVAASAKPEDQSALGRALEEHLKNNSLRVQQVDITWEQKERIRAQFD
jgi:putative ABC transport system permease protein